MWRYWTAKMPACEIYSVSSVCLRLSHFIQLSFVQYMGLCVFSLPISRMNTERHTAYTIVSWPNPKQWVIVNTSDLMMMIRQSIYFLSIITKGMGKLKARSPTYCIMDNWENMLNLTHTLDKWYLRHFISSMSSDEVCTMMIMRWFNVQTNEYDIDCIILMKTNSRFSRNVYTISEYDVINISGTQQRKNMKTMGKVDTSDLMMIITWGIDISVQSPILKWASWTHTTPYVVMKI